MGTGRQILREKLIVEMRLWPRVEMSRSFVLSELRRFLLVGLCRVEMQRRRSKLRKFLQLGRRKLETHPHATASGQAEATRERRGGVALLRLGGALGNILFYTRGEGAS